MRTLVLVSSALALMSAPAVFASEEPPRLAGKPDFVVNARPGETLEIRLDTGAGLRITSWDRDEISVTSDLTDDKCPDARLSLTRTDHGARLESRYPDGYGVQTYNCSFSVDVRLPKRFDITLRSTGGAVWIDNVDGAVSGHTGGGMLTLERMSGDVRLLTGGGAIHVRDSDLDGTLTTGGGGIEFENVTGPVTARSGSRPGVVRGSSRGSRRGHTGSI